MKCENDRMVKRLQRGQAVLEINHDKRPTIRDSVRKCSTVLLALMKGSLYIAPIPSFQRAYSIMDPVRLRHIVVHSLHLVVSRQPIYRQAAEHGLFDVCCDPVPFCGRVYQLDTSNSLQKEPRHYD